MRLQFQRRFTQTTQCLYFTVALKLMRYEKGYESNLHGRHQGWTARYISSVLLLGLQVWKHAVQIDGVLSAKQLVDVRHPA